MNWFLIIYFQFSNNSIETLFLVMKSWSPRQCVTYSCICLLMDSNKTTTVYIVLLAQRAPPGMFFSLVFLRRIRKECLVGFMPSVRGFQVIVHRFHPFPVAVNSGMPSNNAISPVSLKKRHAWNGLFDLQLVALPFCEPDVAAQLISQDGLTGRWSHRSCQGPTGLRRSKPPVGGRR